MPILFALLLSVFAIDGDTIVLDGRHIRIANIDAPEIHDYHCDAELRLGMLAKRRMAELLASGPLVVHEGDHGRMHDRYGRTLATIDRGLWQWTLTFSPSSMRCWMVWPFTAPPAPRSSGL